IGLSGYPFLKVTNWNRERDLIDFDFCFPVSDISSLTRKKTIHLKKYPSKKALKLIFNGNYRLSHVSWFDLIYLAGERGYEPDGWPMEVYHDNPKIDMNELNWIAEIYLPVND
ncbi:MAG: AraC family transcriptional regulator, partial [Gramella sp.]|nr:AraC family transcriptional regulator [Christiangramia sp.]